MYISDETANKCRRWKQESSKRFNDVCVCFEDVNKTHKHPL